MEHTDLFTKKYESCEWGSPINPNYSGSSGDGSSMEYNRDYIKFLKGFIRQQEIKSVVDVGCGDWQFNRDIYLRSNVKYSGYDVYKPMIDEVNRIYKVYRNDWIFEVKDCLKDMDTMVSADLLIIKDVLQHWSDSEVKYFLDKLLIEMRYKFVIIVNSTDGMSDSLTEAGGWRGLSHNHPLLGDYGVIEIFKYNTKSVLLMKP